MPNGVSGTCASRAARRATSRDTAEWHHFGAGCVLHLFRLPEPGADAVVQIGIPDDDAFEGDEPILPGWKIPMAGYFTRPGAAARYEYEFGDGWEHEVTLEAIVPRQTGKRHPASTRSTMRWPRWASATPTCR
jgi:hypothetical protein